MDIFKMQYDFVMNTPYDKQEEIKLQFGYERMTNTDDVTSDNVMFINWINNKNEWKRLEQLLYGDIVDENAAVRRRIANYVEYECEFNELKSVMFNEVENLVDELTKFNDWEYLLYNKEDDICQFERFQDNLRRFEYCRKHPREHLIDIADSIIIDSNNDVNIFDTDNDLLIRFNPNIPISLQIKERKAEYEEVQRYRNEMEREHDLKKYNELRKKLFDNA